MFRDREMRITLSAILIGIASLVLASSAVAESNSKRAVRIAGATYLGDLPTYVAEELGFFTENALEATVQYNDSGKQNMALLRAGDVDFALMALTPFVLDRITDPDPGQPDDPVILASLLQSHELTALMASHASGIESPADLGGRRIALEPGTNTEFVWWLFVQFHGIDPSSVETIPIPFSETSNAFLSGRVDAVVLPEPWASRLEAQLELMGRNPPHRFDTNSLYAGRWVVVTTQRHVLERRDACRDVLKAYRQASEFIERAPGNAISIYIRSLETPNSPVELRWEALDFDISLDWALIASLREQFRWARDVGIGNAGEPVRVLELLEPGPLHDGWPTAVKIPVAARGDRRP